MEQAKRFAVSALVMLTFSGAVCAQERAAPPRPKLLVVDETGSVVPSSPDRGVFATLAHALVTDPEERPRGDAAPHCAPPLLPEERAKLVRRLGGEEGLEEGLVDAMARVERDLPGDAASTGQGGIAILARATTGENALPCFTEGRARLGVTYLRELLKSFRGDLAGERKAFAGGPARVKAATGISVTVETTAYVAAVLDTWSGERAPTGSIPARTETSRDVRPADGWIDGHVINVE